MNGELGTEMLGWPLAGYTFNQEIGACQEIGLETIWGIRAYPSDRPGVNVDKG